MQHRGELVAAQETAICISASSPASWCAPSSVWRPRSWVCSTVCTCLVRTGSCVADVLHADPLHMQAVESVKRGRTPQEAAEAAVARIVHFYATYVGALVVADPQGNIGAACHGWTFQYTMLNNSLPEPLVVDVVPSQSQPSTSTA